ncbi:MAG: hypothetical protein O2843_05440 [Chloroflexi bacterium]|nr:hypothetical protein [Chloroflexota bacterium]
MAPTPVRAEAVAAAPARASQAAFFAAVERTERTTIAVLDERTMARQKGYEGDPCDECGQLMMVRNGTCLKCMNCGATSGCS